MQTNSDRQLEAGNRRQISDPLLHVDSRLACILCRLKGRQQFVSHNLNSTAAIAIDRAIHPFQTTLNRIHGLGIPEPLE